MNALARLINSVVFQSGSDGMLTDSDSEETNCLSIGELMNNLYTQRSETESHSETHSELSEYSEYQRPRLLSVEGNIGAGKSTLIENLKETYAEDPRFYFILEPVDQWEKIRDKNGKNMIQKFYENSEKYAFAFQVMAFQTRLQLLKDALRYAEEHTEVTTIVMERSLEADYHIFAKMLFEEGVMEDVQYQIYVDMASNALKEYSVDGIIWLDTDYEECFRRVEKREREGEGGKIHLRYLNKCHQYHTEWLGADLGFVCRVDGNGEIDLAKISNYLE